MKRCVFLLMLFCYYGCSVNNAPSIKEIKGTWGLSGMRLNEDYAKTKLGKDEIVASRMMLGENFKNLLKENYSIIEINDSISFYHRKLGVESSNYKDDKAYVYDYSAKYDIIKKGIKYYVSIYVYGDTTNLEIFKLSSNKLMIEAENSQGLGINEFKRIK